MGVVFSTTSIPDQASQSRCMPNYMCIPIPRTYTSTHFWIRNVKHPMIPPLCTVSLFVCSLSPGPCVSLLRLHSFFRISRCCSFCPLTLVGLSLHASEHQCLCIGHRHLDGSFHQDHSHTVIFAHRRQCLALKVARACICAVPFSVIVHHSVVRVTVRGSLSTTDKTPLRQLPARRLTWGEGNEGTRMDRLPRIYMVVRSTPSSGWTTDICNDNIPSSLPSFIFSFTPPLLFFPSSYSCITT